MAEYDIDPDEVDGGLGGFMTTMKRVFKKLAKAKKKRPPAAAKAKKLESLSKN